MERRTQSIVADGAARVALALRAELQSRINEKYAEELKQAGWLQRLRLHRRMRRELASEMARSVSPYALYGQAARDAGSGEPHHDAGDSA